MKTPPISRRRFLAAAAPAAGLFALGAAAAPAAPPPRRPFRFALNTATISGYKLSLAEQLEVAAKAGYQGIEPWLHDLAAAAKNGTLRNLTKRRTDLGLEVVGAIAFPAWVVDDPIARAKGLQQMEREMGLVAQFGGKTIAAPPAGAYDPPRLDLDRVAERYRAALELGAKTGVTPQLEFWGGSSNLSRLDQCVYVAARAAHPDACVLADVFHLYRGGSDVASLHLLGKNALRCFHVNDYPASPERARIQDSDRVWPGDGVAPWREIFAAFAANDAAPWLSLEVFNTKYWKTDALETARAGLAKLRAVVEKSRA